MATAYRQAFVVTMESGRVFRAVVMADSSDAGRAAATAEARRATGAAVWDCCAFPVEGTPALGLQELTAPYVVTVEAYSLEPGRVGEYERTIYESSHKSPRAAARRLAELINGRTARAQALKPALGGRGGRYLADGLSLATFRARHGLKG
jgi:hypothetical protein